MTLTMTAPEQAQKQTAGMTGSEKHLAFNLGKEEYAIPTSCVREIMGLQEITPVPQTPAYMRGVLNLRGRIIPIVDLRSKCGLAGIEYGAHACIIVVQVTTAAGTAVPMGLVVDGVLEVMTINKSEVENMPEFGDIAQEYLLGVAKCQGKVRVLLDINLLLSSSELNALNNTANTAQR